VTAVLDASAILAWVQDETGADMVDVYLDGAVVSAVNWSEVLQKVRQHGRDAQETSTLLLALGVEVSDATGADAVTAARLWDVDRPLSLGDRFCLALGSRLGVPVLTAERAWADVEDVAVELIR